MIEGPEGGSAPKRLTFGVHAQGGIRRLALHPRDLGTLAVETLELEIDDATTATEAPVAERYQRRRTRLRGLALRISTSHLEARVAHVTRALAGLGITQVFAKLHDGFISVRARTADGLAAADVSFRVHVVTAGTHLRALASTVRVHGHLPTPASLIADRILGTLFATSDVPNLVERPHARGLCDVEIDVVGALLWQLMPPSGWRLPSVANIELVHLRIGRAGIELAYGPAGTRAGELGIRPQTHQLAAAHDLMHSADQQLREGHLEEAMRGYRALLAAGGPEQPLLLERILALAASRPAWFFDGLELARQALGRWPTFAPAHAALASITLAQGDAREAAGHLTQLAQLASAEGDDDQATLSALAGARLVRVLDPKAATQLYQLALEHDPGSAEAADSLADRLADEQRWPELVRLVRARAVITADVARAVQLRLRLANVFVSHLGDAASAQQELAVARELAPGDPAVHEMAATILATIDPAAAIDAWTEVARLADERGDHRTSGHAWAVVGDMRARTGTGDPVEAWQRALSLDPLQAEAIAGLAQAAAQRGDHETAADLYERLRGLGLGQQTSGRHELALARSLVVIGRTDDARAALRRATVAGGETAAEAHAVLAEVAEAAADRDHAAAELDTAIVSLVDLASTDLDDKRDGGGEGERLLTRAAELAIARAALFDRTGQAAAASADLERAHELAQAHAPAIARDAARTLLERSGEDTGTERRWIDAVLATRPPPSERAVLLVRRADVRRKERAPDLAAALADLHEALRICESLDTNQNGTDPEATQVRRHAYEIEAELLARSGDQRARAQALAALANMSERASERIEREAAAAAAWLAADEPAAALPHGARAHASIEIDSRDVPPALKREVLLTLGEAAWRQRAWPDVLRAYRSLIEDPGEEAPRIPTFRYRLAVAADRSGDPALALASLAPLVETSAAGHELRGQALRLYADLAERTGELAGAAKALEDFASLSTDGSPTARADAMYRAGELFRRADRGDDAIRCLEHALRISDSHLPALDGLETAWRERGDLERVSVILGRKVAITGRQPARQKPLLSRLGDLQAQLGRHDVALATHQRALEIDPSWRPSLRFVTLRLREEGQLTAAAGGLAQLAGELAGDGGVDPAVVAAERKAAAAALGELVAGLGDDQLDAVRDLVFPALERAGGDAAEVAAGLARLGGARAPAVDEAPPREESTASGRATAASGNPITLREAAKRARTAGKLDEAFATLETANHVAPGDRDVLQELVELAQEMGDHEAAARHLTALAELATGARKANLLLELAEVYFDHLDDPAHGRLALRAAAEAFGKGARREATLRMLAAEARANLAWDAAVEALRAITPSKRTSADVGDLAHALVRAGKDAEAIAYLEDPKIAALLGDGGALLADLREAAGRKHAFAAALEQRAETAPAPEAGELRDEASAIRAVLGGQTRIGIGIPPVEPAEGEDLPLDKPDLARLGLLPLASFPAPRDTLRGMPAAVVEPAPPAIPSVAITGTPEETESALALAAAAADGDALLAAHHAEPDDAAILLALLAHLASTNNGAQRKSALENAVRVSHGPALAIALHELATLAREEHELVRAAALWTRAHEVDPFYEPVWLPLADALAAGGEHEPARRLYAQIAADSGYDVHRRAYARERAETLGRPAVPEPVGPPPQLGQVKALAEVGNVEAAIELAEQVAGAAAPGDTAALEALEALYFQAGNVTAASEAIGRQLQIVADDATRAALWRRRAKLYRDTLDRDAEAYRCLKEAHACAPDDPEIAYQLRAAAMARGEWALAASLLYREIAATDPPREKGALHLELALILDEKLDDDPQAQVNYEQALALDPSIPAAKLPLARRYEAIDRFAEAAQLYEDAAAIARPSDRGELLEAAVRARTASAGTSVEPAAARRDLDVELAAAEAAGELDVARELAHQLWRAEPGHELAFRVLATDHRASGNLAALTELTTVRAAALEAGAPRAAAWLEVARLADELGADDQAARAYDLVLVEDPAHLPALDARAALAFRLRDYQAADTLYRDLDAGTSALGADELAHRRSIIAEHLGRDAEALEFASAAADAAPHRRELRMRVLELATRLGELRTALEAAHAVLDLVPLEDDETKLSAHGSVVDLLRQNGDLPGAIDHLQRVLRDHPMHAPSLEALADLHIARGDWPAATRVLYQLVPLAPTPSARAERLYQLGEAVLVHLGDTDRADDVFLRASDLDPSHLPTLRRLLDVYWRADDPGALVEVATELAGKGALSTGAATDASLAHALVAAALVGDTQLASQLGSALGEEAPRCVAVALAELDGRAGRLQLATASTAVAELARRGLLDLAKVRAAAAGTPVEPLLSS